MDEKLKETLASIPRTQEELDEIRGQIAGHDVKHILDKAYVQNERIELCQRMVRMFGTEEFKLFWKEIHQNMSEMVSDSPSSIKGEFWQKVERLFIVQGGQQILDSQEIQKKVIEKTAEGKTVDTAELEEKLKVISQNQ